ncbi:MAG: hypothetical protein KatS3mg118_2708 [Paracoccaceae bacterium]|nr:MAG: hypothetical protein KatS3mg118_2708 [Paracoccaceae bacterium]
MADGRDEALRAWRELARRELRGRDPEALVWHTPEGIAVSPLYTAADVEGLGHLDSHAGPAALRPRPARDHVCRKALDDPAIRGLLDRRGIERLLPQGAAKRASRASRSPSTSPPTAAMTATTRAVEGDVGKAGVAIDSVEDMKILFEGIPLDRSRSR